MSTALPDFLTKDEYGYIHITGHRLGLSDVVFFYRQGDSPEMLHARFATISLPLIHKIIAFYLENQSVIDDYCSGQASQIEKQRAEGISGPTREELKKRRETARLAQGA